MTQENIGRHHFHKRKRIHEQHEKYPHPNKWKRFMDKAIFFFAILGPMMTLPQAAKIWVNQNAAGVSLISWIGYDVGAVFWLMYGVMHKDKPIIATNIMWLFMNTFVVVGTIMYR